MTDLEVVCYSGHTYAEWPRSFRWRGREYRVERIEKAWQEPGKRCFQVVTGENERFQLCYNEADKSWSLTELGKG
ncbi:MAG: hypothetical protein HY530_00200 [Chloroflexi bacterium]|nr:hypothetical protein [Chloroflexota bacterium]